MIYTTPGVYLESERQARQPQFQTGVPLFLGFAPAKIPAGFSHKIEPVPFSLWNEFEQKFGHFLFKGYLADAIQGFFQNGGKQCFVQLLYHDPASTLFEIWQRMLESLEANNSFDLICAPDIGWLYQQAPESKAMDIAIQLQTMLLHHCDKMEDRFAILDSMPGADLQTVLAQRKGLVGNNGALYYPWTAVSGNRKNGRTHYIPPSGHVAGVYARCDQEVGPHKAPANEALEAVQDLEMNLTGSQQADLNPKGINCLRSFPGRGIRVWGARTLSEQEIWSYINVRRLFLTIVRWLECNTGDVMFQPNDHRLWESIERHLTEYCRSLYEKGALKGHSIEDAFRIKCDAETNPSQIRELGKVVTEIYLAPVRPNEFIAVRLIHSPSGVSVTGLPQPG